jgi:E3 ubiquitin-protein ligase MYCBP2
LASLAQVHQLVKDHCGVEIWSLFVIFSLQWPTNSVVLPGNEVIFSLETASDYLKDDRSSSYGFKCLVVGYEWPPAGNASAVSGLKHLEAELAFLGGMCAASMMKKDLQLPTVGGKLRLNNK